jgi:hypothetical protein
VPPSVLCGRIVAPGDPLWEQDDTDLALALTQIEAERCDCGHSRAESMDPVHEFDWRAEFVRCHACAARDRAARNTDDAFDSAGVRWITMRSGDD